MKWWIVLVMSILQFQSVFAFETCPANQKVLNASFLEMEYPRFWSLCNQIDLQFNRQNLSDIGILNNKISKALDTVEKNQASLVRVSSSFYDVVQKKWKVMQGVGSIVSVFKNSRSDYEDSLRGPYYILTAHHVASGANLSVQDASGQLMPIESMTHDFVNDLSLLKINLSKLSHVPFPFASYFIDKDSLLFQSTSLSQNKEVVTNRHSLESFKVSYIEGLDALILNGIRSFVPTAPWLTPLDNSNSFEAPLFARESENNIKLSFAKSFSGSPVVVSYKNRNSSFYEVSGLLSTCSQNCLSTKMTSSKALKQIFRKALHKKSGISGEWFLFNDYYVKIQKESILFYLINGPIGNGVAIDGRLTPEMLLMQEQLIPVPPELWDLSVQMQNQLKTHQLNFKNPDEEYKKLLIQQIEKSSPNLKIKLNVE